MTATQLPDETYEKIVALSGRADELASAGNYETAIGVYNEAWQLLPEPKAQWEAATWVLAAIADAAFLGGYPVMARQAVDYVMHCPGAVGNPFLHLRRGQVLLDQQEPEAAADELMRAYMGAGAEIFSNEDPKYLEFLRQRAELPSD